jgi:glutamate-1-semialdehyde aminotransferase
MEALQSNRTMTLRDLVLTVAHFYHWTIDYVLHSMSCRHFWAALDHLVQVRKDEAEAAAANPLAALLSPRH